MPVHTNKPGYFGKGSVEIGPAAGPGEGPFRRIAISSESLITQPFEGIKTVYDVLEYSARTHRTRRALGWREIVDIHEEEKEVKKVVGGKEVTEKKKWKYFQLSDYKYINFIELKDAVSEIAKGLVQIGVTSDDVFNIFSQTSVNWQLMANACGSISTTIATAYDTLGESGLTHSLNDPECVGLFTNAELLPTLYKVLANTPSIKLVVYDGEPSENLVGDINAVRESIQVFSIDEIRELGKSKPTEPLRARLPKPETMACIMYTSGSTGPPKGVCITHANLVASIGAVYKLLGHHLTYDDTYLAYLPLAHMLEYIVELIMLFVGMTSGYGRVKTLTDASVRQCKGDLAAFQPSIMVGVPAVWETIRKGIVAKVNAGGTVRKSVFNGAMSLKKNGVPVLSQVADSVVKCAGGDRRQTTNHFIWWCCSQPRDAEVPRYCIGNDLTSVGLPVPSIEIKLLDVKEAGYLYELDSPFGGMSNFGTDGSASKLSSEERFQLANPGRTVSMSAAGFVNGLRGPDSQLHTGRTRSKRGDKRPDANRAPPRTHHQHYGHAGQRMDLVFPLNLSLHCDCPRTDGTGKPSRMLTKTKTPEIADRKVKSLKLTMEKFDSNADKHRCCCCCHKGNAAPTTVAKIHEAKRPPSPITFGPSSVFAGKKESKRESLSRTNFNANMFQMLQNVEAAEVATKTGRRPSRKPSVDLGSGGAPEPAPQRKRLNFLPRTKPVDQDSAPRSAISMLCSTVLAQ
ncbi:hypothetical protein HHX47_DHR2000845 [Lentinula edodes]|nr:hypothetical protein HHX47_DHR2000845 [Lentinula edodes]